MEHRMIFAGFGGQGILLAGQLVAEVGMTNGKNVTWMPSYGPEMRGGFANCSVVVSDEIIGTPIITHPDLLVAMNQPSFDLFGPKVVPGGTIIYNSSLVKDELMRDDVTMIPLACNEIAAGLGQPKAANMPLIGVISEMTHLFSIEEMREIMMRRFGEKRADLIEVNLQAMKLGRQVFNETLAD
jgi:2-oxoglutarate ferredoxin oxidoreductase subunit gamma